ncbi:MAG: Thymidylate kinase [Candidatus Omnitrophica bacterium ADurb.Bin292]|jgi:dTMP kinase|nr:MAG: Thymidylate kinase [Candidatus Omnitrophica bacterium ADurb.Bin292]HOG23462.1 dTMP kinase [Candidatus Omnitrophota bacterium]HPW76438.1 dTMP kinase [Candidatus Omnitrophota bacterium]HQB11533.1 dTMP kinase [Candidatus Omnitrophota bacterium]
MKKKGIFITFEGAEGSGKSTQIREAAKFFRKKGREVILLREPGGTKISELIRKILLDRANQGMSHATELFLYLAARAQVVEEKILPALREGKVVIADRFEDSTRAYQGFGRGFSLEAIESMSRLVRGTLIPDLTFVLDVDITKGLARGGRHDRIEWEALSFHRKVRQGYLTLARKEPGRMLVLDTDQPVSVVKQCVLERLQRVFGK